MDYGFRKRGEVLFRSVFIVLHVSPPPQPPASPSKYFIPRNSRQVIFYAITSGGFNALLPTTLLEIFGPENYSSVNGFLYFIRGCGAVMGSPVGGLLLPDHTRLTAGDYTSIILFDGGLLIGSAVSVGLVRVNSHCEGVGIWG